MERVRGGRKFDMKRFSDAYARCRFGSAISES